MTLRTEIEVRESLHESCHVSDQGVTAELRFCPIAATKVFDHLLLHGRGVIPGAGVI